MLTFLIILAAIFIWLMQLAQIHNTFNIFEDVWPDIKCNRSWFYLLYLSLGVILVTLFGLGYMTTAFFVVGLILTYIILVIAITAYILPKLDWSNPDKLDKDIKRLRTFGGKK